MGALSGRTMVISGGSRGIGLAIALRVARDGANVALIAKTAQPHPRLPNFHCPPAPFIEHRQWQVCCVCRVHTFLQTNLDKVQTSYCRVNNHISTSMAKAAENIGASNTHCIGYLSSSSHMPYNLIISDHRRAHANKFSLLLKHPTASDRGRLECWTHSAKTRYDHPLRRYPGIRLLQNRYDLGLAEP
jgi:hypothetical protein